MIRLPSGEKSGRESLVALDAVRLTGLLPSAFITNTSRSPPSRSLSKTIRLPSGENEPKNSAEGKAWVMLTGPEPLAFIR